jgi:hypothetical protein
MNGKKLFLVAVDGRTPEAAGMTCEELAKLMIELGCTWALNLDGGGSTTMWVRGKGVVSNPCDDKKFDPAGERAVANAVLVLAPDVVVADTDAAKFEGEWKRQKATADHLGADYAVGSGSAKWTLKIEFAGTYELFARCPKGGTWRAGALEARPTGAGWVSLGTLKLEPGTLEIEARGEMSEPRRSRRARRKNLGISIQ